MTSLARRELVATIVSLAGTALPFGIGGEDDRKDESEERGDGPEGRGGASNGRRDAPDDRPGESDDRGDKPEDRSNESADRGEESDGRNGGDVDDAELTGVVDRIEGELAVVLLERAEETIGERLVPVGRLPADAREAGAVLSVTLADGEIERLRYDADATQRRRDAAQDRFDELAEDASEAS